MRLKCVTYKQAKELKKLGFDWWADQSYVGGEFVSWMGWRNGMTWKDYSNTYPNHSKPKEQIAAPELDLVLKYFHKKYLLHSSVEISTKGENILGYWHSGYYFSEEDIRWNDWTDLDLYETEDKCKEALVDFLMKPHNYKERTTVIE